MSDLLKGKVAVVTGSTGELGEVIARKLATAGASVVVCGRNHALGEKIVEEIGSANGVACYLPADVSIADQCVSLIDQTVERFGSIDILVNNAAHLGSFLFEELQADDWDSVFATNTRGPAFLCKAAIPHMKARGEGSIVNIGTTMVYRNGPGSIDRLAYVASKGALLTLTKAFARALAPEQIRSNWITVGWIATRGELDYRGETEDQLLERARETLPMGRLEKPEEVADSVLYLASEQSSHVTGCELNISGGLHV